MKKVAVVGPYGVGADFTTGQAVKCFETINWLKKKYGDNEVYIVNTYKWKKNPLKLFFSMIKAFVDCKNVIIMPAENGAKVFIPMSYRLKKIYKRQVHYIVIGGWLKEALVNSKRLKKSTASFEGVYVETKSMVQQLESIGLINAFFMPNCRYLPDNIPVKPENWNEPIPVCTYSRVTKDKGIPDAVDIIKKANEILGKNAFKLDIYGKVASEFQEEFDCLLKENQEFVTYCGVKKADEGIETLSAYFALLFPTYYFGEGFAGTILDAFASGTPTIANDWKYNSEIITSGENGFIYPYRDNCLASELLCKLLNDYALYKYIQKECYESAKTYSTETVMNKFALKMC